MSIVKQKLHFLLICITSLCVVFFYQNCSNTFTANKELSLSSQTGARLCKINNTRIVNQKSVIDFRISNFEKESTVKLDMNTGDVLTLKILSTCGEFELQNLSEVFDLGQFKLNSASDFNFIEAQLKNDLSVLEIQDLLSESACLYGVDKANSELVNFSMTGLNDPQSVNQGHLLSSTESFAAGMKIKEVWDLIYTGTKAVPKTGAPLVKVAVIGSDFSGMGSHPDLITNRDSAVGGSCSNNNSACNGSFAFNVAPYIGVNYSYYIGHEAHIAGLIAATPNNSVGVVGIAPWRVSILSYQGDSETAMANAVNKAVSDGADIITISFGYTNASADGPIVQAVKNAVNQGRLVTMAAGNSAVAPSTEPQRSTHSYVGENPANPATGAVIVVGATEVKTGAMTCFSNRGVGVDIYSPGATSNDACVTGPAAEYLAYSLNQGLLSTGYRLSNQASTSPSAGYVRVAGTSMSAPVMAASAALLMAYYKQNSKPFLARDIENLFKAQSDPLSSSTDKRLNLFKTIEFAVTPAVAPPPPPQPPQPSSSAITSPTNGAVMDGSVMSFSANYVGVNNPAKAVFYVNQNKIGEDSSAPYTYELRNMSAGQHSLKVEFVSATNQILSTTNNVNITVSASALPDCP